MKSQFKTRREPIQKALDLTWGRFSLPIGRRTLVMGVLNRTPDSFSDGGLFMDEGRAVEHALQMVREGADIIDIGGESTRPGAEAVSAEIELARTVPLIKRLAGGLKIPISIDTSKSEVASSALENGAAMINDITGLKSDPLMAKLASDYDVPVVVMHIKGAPRSMQENPIYVDLIGEIIEGLRESINIALEAGVDEDKIIIDPGIGFGKAVGDNLQIINRLSRFKILGKPILIGVSRKSFIGKVLDLEVDKRLIGTAAAAAIAIANGAGIIRVHDVAQMRQVAKIADAIDRGLTSID